MKRKIIVALLGILVLSLSILLINTQSKILTASAVTTEAKNTDDRVADENKTDRFIVTEYSNIVEATYSFVRLNESECSVRVTNKTLATKAIIPATTKIDGVTYKVTEVAANGFTSSTKLIKVSLPHTIKKIGKMAFANCTKLERISLANVEEIGDNAFYRCISLKELVIPKSTKTIGLTILRNNDTKVRVRSESEYEGWAPTWNSGNNDQNIEFNSTYIEPLELEIYNDISSYASDFNNLGEIAYVLASGQPRTDDFYVVKNKKEEIYDEEVKEVDKKYIFVPAEYNGIPIKVIDRSAFEGSSFEQLIIEYSEEPIYICSNAFEFSGIDPYETDDGEAISNITINRPVEFYNYDILNDKKETEADNIFVFSNIKSIVLPYSISGIAKSMFAECQYLTNIYFTEPKSYEEDINYELAKRNMLKIVKELADRHKLGVVYLPNSEENKDFNTIGASAFDGTTSIKEMHLYNNLTKVEESVFANWIDNPHSENLQTVYVHNTGKIPEDWSPDLGFTHILYDIYFYKITFDPNGGTFTEIPEDYEKIFNSDNTTILSVAIVVPDNIEFDELPTVFYDNNVLTGWEDSKGNKYNIGENYTFDSDTILYAKWERIYTISFNANGGTVSPEEIQVVHNNKIGKMPTPKNGNFQFNGWYYNETQYTEETIYYNDFSISLTARWIETYEITFDPNGGTVSPTSKIVVLNDDIGNLPEPTNGLHIFEGWYMGNTEYTSSTEYTIKDDIILTAKWTYRYTIHIDPNGGSLDYDSFVVVFGQPINNIPESEKPGNKFLGWFDKNHKEYKNGDIFELNEDLYLKADWKKIIYITLDDQDGKNTTHIVEAFNNEKLPLVDINGEELGIPPKTGYVFLGYYTQKEGGTPLYINESDKLISEDCPFESDTTLYGQYDYFRYEINYIYDSRGIENSNRKDFTINDVINNTFTFKPIVDYNHSPAQKVLWSIKNIGEAAKTNYLEDKCIEVVGSWSNIELHISYNLNGGTNNSVNPSVLYYGDHIVLSSPSRVGYEFLEWRDDKGFYVSDEIFYVYITDLKYDNMSLTAQWRNRINAVKTTSNYTDKEITVTRDTIIELPKRNFSSTCVINVSSAANKLHIYSPNGSTYNLRLIIEPRLTEGFELILEHLTMTLPVSYSTEKNEEYCILSYTKLNLYTYGFVAIKGRNGANGNIYGNKNGGDGMAAIRCSMLEVHRADNLLITGGNGGIAASGTGITDNGGKAGSGAVAIILVFTNNPPILCENVEVYGGCSGDNKTCMNGWYNIPPTVTPPHLKN